ncbi:MAG: pectinacetylesterase family protein, partial [Polyangiaceae bacterium]|nr:pectinacetylesterase family protein [Polyangiaceae bacterium]
MADQYHFRAGAKIISAMCMGALAGIGGCSSSIADADSSAVDASGSTHDSGGSTADSGGSTADSGGSTANPDGSTSQTDGPTTDTGGCAAGAGGSIARELGLTQYSGQITPNVLATDGDITTYQFDPAQGPVCMRGDEFRTFVRDVGSKDVAIFQQDGGLCWSGFCFATNKAATEMPRIDILDPALAENPVAKWNHVFVPYCDGSLFA